MIKSATAKDLYQWLQKGEAVVVDVREPNEYAEGHIEGSTLVPLATVTAAKMPPHQGKKLVVHCKSGGRSKTACGKLSGELPDLEVYNLEGGIMGWAQAGLPVRQ